MNTMSQEVINRMWALTEGRERRASTASERANRNQQVVDLITELTDEGAE